MVVCCVYSKGNGLTALAPSSRGLLQEVVVQHAAAVTIVSPDIALVSERLRGSGSLHNCQECVENLKRMLKAGCSKDMLTVCAPRRPSPHAKAICQWCHKNHTKA